MKTFILALMLAASGLSFFGSSAMTLASDDIDSRQPVGRNSPGRHGPIGRPPGRPGLPPAGRPGHNNNGHWYPHPGWREGWHWNTAWYPTWYKIDVIFPRWSQSADLPHKFWQCTSFNQSLTPFTAIGPTQDQAAYGALFSCGADSYEKAGCYIPENYCRYQL